MNRKVKHNLTCKD